MSAYAVWLDKTEAKIFKFMPGRARSGAVEAQILHRKELRHNSEEKYFHEIVEHISDATELLILGPGLEKALFKKHIEDHYDPRLAKSIVAVEPLNNPAENRVVSTAKKFFRRWAAAAPAVT